MFEQVLTLMGSIIQNSQVRNLNEFFYQHDCYVGRMLEPFELQVIFNLTAEQAREVSQGMGEPGEDGKISFEKLVGFLKDKYCKGIPLLPLQPHSMYVDKIRNIQLPLGFLESTAKSVALSSHAKTYRQAFDSKVTKINQNTLDKDELFGLLGRMSIKLDPKEAEEIFGYLAIGGARQISKIQFVQGFKQIMPENSAASQNLNLQQNQTDPISDFLLSIQVGLKSKGLTISQAIQQATGFVPGYLLTRQQLADLGNFAMAKPLIPYHFDDLMQQLQDKNSPGQINIHDLQNKLEAVEAQSKKPDHPAVSGQHTNLEPIKAYMQKNYYAEVEELFPNKQILPGGVVTVDKQEFLTFLTAKIALSRQDAETIANAYLTHQGSSKINLALIKADLASAQSSRISGAGSSALTLEKAKENVNQVFDAIKKYLALNGGNIVSRFRELDVNGDRMIQQDEMKQTLSKVGLDRVDENIITSIYMLYDPQNSGSIIYYDFCVKFYEYANAKAIKDVNDWAFPIFDQVRKYLKLHRATLCSLFSTDTSANQVKKEVHLESYSFFELLKSLGVKIDMQKEQRLQMKLGTGDHKIDFLLFCDFVGYEQPEDLSNIQIQPAKMGAPGFSDTQQFRSTMNKDYRKNFYRVLTRHLKQNGVGVNRVEMSMGQNDVQNKQVIPLTTFTNQLMAFTQGSELFYKRDLIESIGKDFDNGNNNQVFYGNFIQKLGFEMEKLRLLEQFYWSMKQALDFKASQNLYELLQAYDQRRDKKFNRSEIEQIFRGKAISITDMETEYLFDEYDSRQTGFIEYAELEKDYQDFVQWINLHKPQQNMGQTMNLPQILRIIKSYSDTTGRSLREIFKKTKVGDTDEISKFDFTKLMTEIGNHQVDSNSLDKLTQELDVLGKNVVPFTELMKRYNEEFHIREDPYESKFNQRHVQQVYWHIASIVAQRKGKLSLDFHFEVPTTTPQQFLRDLEKEPMSCHKICTRDQLDEIAKSYQQGHYIDTRSFIMDLNEKVSKLNLRNQHFLALKTQLQFRGSTIEDIFQNIKGLGKYKDENLALEEYFAVFMSIEFKIDTQQLKQILETFQQDHEGKVSYLDFIREFKELSPHRGGPQARKFFNSVDEILLHIADFIMKRGIKYFGSLLAGYDIKANGKIERDGFYRVIDSMKLGLGEGDIQELIRTYDSLNLNEIPIVTFADDLNRHISDYQFKVNLKSIVNETVHDRIVEPSTPTPRTSLEGDRDFKNTLKNMKLVKDIQCGLVARSKEMHHWFSDFTKQPNSMIQTDFVSALDQLDVVGTNQEKIDFFASLLEKQNRFLGYKSHTLQIDFLVQSLNRECSQNKDQLVQEIMYGIAEHLTETKVAVRDQFLLFDATQSGQVFRNEFSSNILENYLRLSGVLTPNAISLLVQIYDPQQTFRINYNSFISDLKRIESENQRTIKIFLTQHEVDDNYQRRGEEPGADWVGDDDHHHKRREQLTLREPEPEATSKKNTVVNERQIVRPMKLQFPSFHFEDLMIATARKLQAVEVYFMQFGASQGGVRVIEKDKFFEAISKLNFKWADPHSVSQLFDSIAIQSQSQQLRFLDIDDIGMAVLQNAQYNLDDYQAKYVEVIYKQLKAKNLLPKLRDIFNFFNSRRDNTCSAKEFRTTILDKMDKQTISDSQIDLLILRYKASGDASRVHFTQFIKDIELIDKGISPTLLWATEFAEDLMKSIIIKEYASLEQFFAKFSKLQGIIIFDEFKRAMEELQLTVYHDETEQRDFFNSVDSVNQRSVGGGIAEVSKIGLTQLVNSIQKLFQKSLGQMYQEILERIHSSSKKQNMTQSVFHIFNEFDPQRTGHCSFFDFKYGIEQKLKAFDIKAIDLEMLAKKYKPASRGAGDLIQYEKFFQDYERIEKMGMRAGEDPLKTKKPEQETVPVAPSLELPPKVKEIYTNMGNYVQKLGFVDGLCEELVKRDVQRCGQVIDGHILETFKQFKMQLNKSQMSLILHVLPFDRTQGTYNYIVMIELLFGKSKMLQVQSLHQIHGSASNTGLVEKKPLVMTERFKDQIELKLHSLTAYAHQQSKGTWQLREQEYFSVFKKAQVSMQSQDIELLQSTFRQLMNPQSKAIDFNAFKSTFLIQSDTSAVLTDLQREVQTKNLKIDELIKADSLTFEEFTDFLKAQQIDLKKHHPDQVKKMYLQMCDTKQNLDKLQFAKLVGKDSSQDRQGEEVVPYIVNELAYFIVNKNLNIFKVVNPQAKVLTKAQFTTLLTQVAFKPSQPKELDSLILYLASDDKSQNISIDKLVQSVRKIDPMYGEVKPNLAKSVGGKHQKPESVQNVKAAQMQLSQFNVRVKNLLAKINAHLKKSKVVVSQLYTQIDKNKNGLIERSEFLDFFGTDIVIQGIGRTDYEVLYEALDSNRDGFLSINEFCLYLEGTRLTQEQKLQAFDQGLEKDMKMEIEKLFQFFDKNGDGKISVLEVETALRSVNQKIGQKEAQDMVTSVDTNKNGYIDKDEFEALLLPRFKEEMILCENNLDDLRRLFKETDTDHSNYLNRAEMLGALMKHGIELTEFQLDDLMSELDQDENAAIDIDEFIAFLSIADQFKFKNPQSKTTLINIRRARKLNPVDFFNSFKNLPQYFHPSFTQDRFEKMNLNTPSHGIFPDFDPKTMQYRDIAKLGDLEKVPHKKFIETYGAAIGCEIQMEEISGVLLPKKEDFDWAKISHREVRAVIFDMHSKEYLSNSFLIQANWNPQYETKWLFNHNASHTLAKNFLVKTDLLQKENLTDKYRDVHVLFELVLYTTQQNVMQQVTCAWGSLSVLTLDKSAKLKVNLKGGSPFMEMDIDPADAHQSKKGFSFLKKIVVNTGDSFLSLSVKPQLKFSEQTQLYLAALPSTCLISKRLLSFAAAFRIHCYRKLIKAQQQMIAPSGDFVIAQSRKILDNPDVANVLGECWDADVAQPMGTFVNVNLLVAKMEEYINKLYSIVYDPAFQLDHIFPTRSQPLESELFFRRDLLIKESLLPPKSKLVKDLLAVKAKSGKKDAAAAEVFFGEEFKPFNIQEMEIQVTGLDAIEAKQDELLKMYQQMGLIY